MVAGTRRQILFSFRITTNAAHSLEMAASVLHSSRRKISVSAVRQIVSTLPPIELTGGKDIST